MNKKFLKRKLLLNSIAGIFGLSSFVGGSFLLLRRQAMQASDSVKRAAMEAMLSQDILVTKDNFNWQNLPPTADGFYKPNGSGPFKTSRNKDTISFSIFGDSTSVGYGCNKSEEFPGVVLSKKIAEDFNKPVKLKTCGKIGATSLDLVEQLKKVLEEKIDVALILIGANDVRKLVPVSKAVEELRKTVRTLIENDVAVVVGTCPNLKIVKSIPQPLRQIVSMQSRRLANHQIQAILDEGGTPVVLGDKVNSYLYSDPDFFYIDEFHPSATGYRKSAELIYPAIRNALQLKSIKEN